MGAHRAVLNHIPGTALPHKPDSSPLPSAPTCSEPLLHISPTGGCRQNITATTMGTLHPQIPRGGRARHNTSPALLFPPQQSIIHLSDISPANLAKQKCCFFDTSRNEELSGETLMVNSPLLFAVVIYSQEWQGCCHFN